MSLQEDKDHTHAGIIRDVAETEHHIITKHKRSTKTTFVMFNVIVLLTLISFEAYFCILILSQSNVLFDVYYKAVVVIFRAGGGGDDVIRYHT